MVRFKQFLLEANSTTLDSLAQDLENLRAAFNAATTKPEKEVIAAQINSKIDEINKAKVAETTATATAGTSKLSPGTTPENPISDDVMKKSAFEGLLKGERPKEFDQDSNLNLKQGYTSDSRGIQGTLDTPKVRLGTETLGRFSKTFYRL